MCLLLQAQNNYVDSIKKLESSADGFQKARYQVDLAWSLMMKNDSLALHYGKLARAYYFEAKRDSHLSEVVYIIGNIHVRNGRADSAINYFLEALDVSKRVKLERGRRSILNAIGLMYKNIKVYDKAIPYFNQMYALAEEAESREDMGCPKQFGYSLLSSRQFNTCASNAFTSITNKKKTRE